MVSGKVRPPQLDLANEDLVRGHVHAIWLAETAQCASGSSLTDVLDVDGTRPTLDIMPDRPDLDRLRTRQATRSRPCTRCPGRDGG